MRLVTSSSARALGLLHVRAWLVTSEQPLLDGAGLGPEAVAEDCGPDAPPIPPGYRQLLTDLGYPGTVPAGERLRETVRNRGWRSHGAVIDAVSAATLRHGAGIGLHHVAEEDERHDLVVARGSGSERIVPAFSSKSRPIPAGDLLYGLADGDGDGDADGDGDGDAGAGLESFAWLGRRDCDAAQRQLDAGSRRALLVVLGCPGEPAAHSEDIGAMVARLLADRRTDIALTPVPTLDRDFETVE